MVMVYVCVYMVSDEDVLVVVELANGITNNTYSDYSPVTAITTTSSSYLSSFTKAVGLGISIMSI